jgi:hypothetical protein
MYRVEGKGQSACCISGIITAVFLISLSVPTAWTGDATSAYLCIRVVEFTRTSGLVPI